MDWLRRQFGLKEAAIACCVALILAFGAIMVQSSYRSERQIIADAETSAESMARSAETGVARTIQSIDAVMLGTMEALATTYRNLPINGPEVRGLLRRMTEQTLALPSIRVIPAIRPPPRRRPAALYRTENYAS